MLARRFRFVLRIAWLGLLLAASGCAFWRKPAAPAPDARPLRLGRVALVNETDRFALIETFSVAAPAAGTVLRIYTGETPVAELRATGVRRRPFLVADFVSGPVAKGDTVFQPPSENPASPRPVAAAAPPVTPAPATSNASNPPKPRSGWRRWLFPFGRQ